MGENNQSSNSDLYLIPESGGKPIKIDGIANVSDINIEECSYEGASYAWCDMPEVDFFIEVTGNSAKILNRFSRRARRYLRRHEQQVKRKTAKRRKCNDNKV